MQLIVFKIDVTQIFLVFLLVPIKKDPFDLVLTAAETLVGEFTVRETAEEISCI